MVPVISSAFLSALDKTIGETVALYFLQWPALPCNTCTGRWGIKKRGDFDNVQVG